MSNTNAADEPIFKALLMPHRSLGRGGFVVLMAAVATLWLGTGLFFLIAGAWPVLGFFGIDLLALYVAFRLNYRAGRQREEVALSRTRLDIRKVAPCGRAEEHRFNPFGTRFSVSRHAEIGITRMAVEARERSVSLGGFLNPDDRESFADAFGAALATAKGR